MSIFFDNLDISNLPVTVTKYLLPWFQIAGNVIRVVRQVISGSATEGTYEVLDYNIKLELKEP